VSIVADIVTGLAKPVTDLLSEFITDKDKAAEIAYKVTTMAAEHAHAELIAQMEVNKIEASSSSVFVSGWRPATGWLCMFGMAVNFVIIPMVGPIVEAYSKVNMAPLDMSTMMPVLLGMLGLTTARTIERVNNAQRDSL